MGTSEQGRDDAERKGLDLNGDLLEKDWNISTTALTTYGVTVTFRKHYTSDFPGMETRTVHAKDDDEAIRIFLKQLEEEADAATQP